MTGTLDENQIRLIQERLSYLRNLEERKLEVMRIIEEQGKLNPELQNAITQATKLQEVEDLYRPYKQKRRTRASMARDKGLEPLAFYLLQLPTTGDPVQEAEQYVDPDKQVTTTDEALTGAMDICAEMVADDTAVRKWVRHETWQRGMLVTEKKAEESSDKHG